MATTIRMAHAIAVRFGEPACRSASAIGSGRRASFTGARTLTFADLLIDCGEDWTPGGAGGDVAGGCGRCFSG